MYIQVYEKGDCERLPACIVGHVVRKNFGHKLQQVFHRLILLPA